MNYRHLVSFFVLGLLVGVIATKLPEIVKTVLAYTRPTPINVVGAGGFRQNMSGYDFQTRDLSFHDFRNFNFSGSTFDGNNFTSSDLRKVNFTDAIVSHVDFSDANLQGAIGLMITDDPENLYDDTAWSNTICPDGTNSDNNITQEAPSGTCIGHL